LSKHPTPPRAVAWSDWRIAPLFVLLPLLTAACNPLPDQPAPSAPPGYPALKPLDALLADASWATQPDLAAPSMAAQIAGLEARAAALRARP